MPHLPHDRLRSVLEARSADDLRRTLGQFAEGLGFEFMSAVWVVDQPTGGATFHAVRQIPPAYLERHSDVASGRRDPVMQFCKTSGLPLVWDRTTYISGREDAMWEEQAAHGLRTGIAFAMHLPHQRHFFFGLDRAAPLPTDSVLDALVAEIVVMSAYAQQAAASLLEPDRPSPVADGRLTPRELESLRWASSGKTAWETGRLLPISERTVVKHLANATAKLGCVRKHQAVAKALRIGLIT